MSDTQKLPLSIQPVISYPREAQVGKTYLMTIDLQPSGDSEWLYEDEEYPIYCMLETSPLFSSKPVGEPAVVLHRFGGSYGAAQFLLTATQEEMEGEIRITLVNMWGMPVRVLELSDIRIRQQIKHTPRAIGIQEKKSLNIYNNEDIIASNKQSLNTLTRAITLSQEQFCLILVWCNYTFCQEIMTQRLQQQCPLKIREFVLPESAQRLDTTLQEGLGNEQPPALMILGLEAVQDLDNLLSAINQVGEEFRKRFSFPIILWVNDQVLRKLVKMAPDFTAWANSPIKFTLSHQQLQLRIQQQVQQFFAVILDVGAREFLPNSVIFGNRYRDELATALRDLQSRNIHLDPKLDASVAFIWGREAYASDRIDQAIKHYQASLGFWQHQQHLEYNGILRYHLGLCWLRYAELERHQNQHYWQEAKQEFQQAIHCFEQAKRWDLVAKYISFLEEVLRRLHAWDELQTLTQTSLELHQSYEMSVQLAQDFGFLAEVALEASQEYEQANRWATEAIRIVNRLPKQEQQQRGLYELLLARSQQHMGHSEQAILTLEQARQNSNPQDNPQLYIDILKALRSLYFEKKDYLELFRIKQEQRAIESLYGLRAFIGAGQLQPKRQAIATLGIEAKDVNLLESIAPEIAASGRQFDVNRLMERITRADCKLIVIYGRSGVGKSSILTAGLVPALQHRTIASRYPLPIVIRVYINWEKELAQRLAAALERYNYNFSEEQKFDTCALTTNAILEALRNNGNRHLLTVLIFDQFEEFFFVNHDTLTRRPFFEFLEDCFAIPYVKVILSLREDYLHYLLEYEGLIYTDILNRKYLYYINNFSPADATSVLKSLTERSYFWLEPALIDQLVKDLAEELGEVRPIELQIVGDQLQTENITTLEQYQKYGKQKLIEQYLEGFIRDCGTENQEVAESVLFFLTDERGNRPLKTYDQIVSTLDQEVKKIDLVLEIFVGAGLVLLLPEVPNNYYQLVHNYLATFIRNNLTR